MDFSRAEFADRAARTLAEIDALGLDALVTFGNKSHPGHVRYLSGYEPELGRLDMAFLVVVPGEAPTYSLLTNAFWDDHRALTWIEDLHITSDFAGRLPGCLPERCRRIGIAGWPAFPAPVDRALRQRFPTADVVDVSACVLRLRSVKSPAEIALMRRIGAICDAGGSAFLDAARAGTSELEIAAQVEAALRRAGSEGLGVATIVGAGPRTAASIFFPTARSVGEREILQLDCGPMLRGYGGDFSRVTVLGKPTDQQRRLLDAVAEMYRRCSEALVPGTRAADVARIGLAVARSRGYGEENLYHSPNLGAGFMGHGLGLANPDPPQLVPTSDEDILPGMVINVEVILQESGVGGARLEDHVLITERGPERLCRTERVLW